MAEKFRHLISIQSSDLEDTRKRTLLNILLGGSFAAAAIGILILAIGVVANLWKFSDASFLIIFFFGFLLILALIFLANRRPGSLAIYLFLALLIVAYTFSDTPANISNGSTVFVYAIPIVMASLLVQPLASFLVAAIGCGIITWGNSLAAPGSAPNFIVMIAFFMLALVSWLSSRSLEEALKNLRAINVNLDHLVQERTQELANSLSRERVEAGRSKAILESIADGVIVFDVKGSAIIANPSSLRLLDLSHENVVGASIEDLSQSKPLNAESRALLAGLLSKPGTKLTSDHLEWGKKTISVTSALVNDTQGANIGTVAVFRDYTHEAEVERMKDTFLAIVSHELRTPLNAILGYAEMIKEAIYGQVNEKQIRASDRIMTNSHRLLDIVSDLLDQGQMEAGKLALHVRPFRPADLIENVHGVMDKIAGDKGLALTSELDPGLPPFINGDIARLQQILVNLINNSVKFTENGSVHMHLSRKDEKNWSLEVRDTGIGIPEAEIPTIFEAFRQVDSTATRKYGGFGLGLSIVKQLTELMEGHIIVTSKLNEGSSFIVTLPLIQAA
jgi:PAS domain S-box-containing protein